MPEAIEVREPRIEEEHKGRKWVDVVYDQEGRRTNWACGYAEAVLLQRECLFNEYIQLEIDIEDHEDDCDMCFPMVSA